MKTRPVGAEFSHADGRTDGPTEMTKLILVAAFRNLSNAHSNRILFQFYETKLSYKTIHLQVHIY